MGQARPIALVVEDDVLQCELLVALLEESEMAVIACASAERALRALKKTGREVSMMFTNANLPGKPDGVDLANFAARHYPAIHVIVASDVALTRSLPDRAMFMPKPSLPLEVLREAARSRHDDASRPSHPIIAPRRPARPRSSRRPVQNFMQSGTRFADHG